MTAGRPVKLMLDAPAQVAPLRTDAGKLRQIIINLISNGIKFTNHGYVLVSIATEPDTNYPIRIDVSDTGIGIPLDKQSVIFDAFRQADKTTAQQSGGTGLGLTITAALCQLMGFRLNVCSEVGRGSTFSVWLSPDYFGHVDNATPLPSSSVIASEVLPFPDPLQDRVVLVVDDEEDSLLLLTRLLEGMGCVSLPATSGEEGLRLAHRIRPDIITLDLLMPETDGWKVLNILKADPWLQNLPVLILTGKKLTPSEKESLSRMASAVLQKSGDMKQDLRRVLTSILPKPQ
jgi:CheY-like chemotaxis protein